MQLMRWLSPTSTAPTSCGRVYPCEEPRTLLPLLLAATHLLCFLLQRAHRRLHHASAAAGSLQLDAAARRRFAESGTGLGKTRQRQRQRRRPVACAALPRPMHSLRRGRAPGPLLGGIISLPPHLTLSVSSFTCSALMDSRER